MNPPGLSHSHSRIGTRPPFQQSESTSRKPARTPDHETCREDDHGGSTEGTGRRLPTLASQIARPVLHEPAPPLEQVRAPVRRLHLVLHHMRQRRLDHLARMIRLLRRPRLAVNPFSHDTPPAGVWRATKVVTAGSGTRRPRRGNHPSSASDSTSRTSSACREMDSFR